VPDIVSDQAKKLAKYFSDKGHEIHFLANGYQGQTLKCAELEDGVKFPYRIYGMGKQPYFADIMSDHLKKTNSDIFIILLDTFMLYQPGGNMPQGWFLNIDTSPAQTFFWFPSDGGGGMPKFCENILKKVEKPVAMAKFGQKQVKDYYGLNTAYIPHGIEPDRFYRLPDDQRKELRKKWGLDDKFVIGIVARNQPRKFLDRTIKAMKILDIIKDKIPNAILLFHSDPSDPAQSFDMKSLIARYNLENRVRFTGTSAQKGFDWSEMNNVYNLFDTFLLTTSGEGFGIPIIEAMSCEIPVLATDYTTTPELILENKAGLGINLVGSDKITVLHELGPLTMDAKEYDDLVINGTWTGSWEVERGVCDVTDAAEKMVH